MRIVKYGDLIRDTYVMDVIEKTLELKVMP